MTDENNLNLEELGVRCVEGYYNEKTGQLEEVQLQLRGSITDDTLYEVNYNVSNGIAMPKLLPDIRKPNKFAKLMLRADIAVTKIQGVDDIKPWHELYMDQYRDFDIKSLEDKMPKFKKADPDDMPDEFDYDR